ncbi:EamA family transporter [Bradyrhizobium canariense]|uniref:EamA family transporter n=1 Tax=Bradyrhizobium canariense TaxID=255045 RepID=UPI0024C0A83A|nr:EamA family transporter [Bradyrhizobium canariense]
MVCALPSTPLRSSPLRWFSNQPYLLLSLTSLFWAGNIVLGRYVAGHVPPMTLSCVRWIGAFLMLLPFLLLSENYSCFTSSATCRCSRAS